MKQRQEWWKVAGMSYLLSFSALFTYFIFETAREIIDNLRDSYNAYLTEIKHHSDSVIIFLLLFNWITFFISQL